MEGDRHSHGMDMAPDYEIPSIAPDSSYFTHDGYSNAIIAHITLMSLAWVFALPISMLLMKTLRADTDESHRRHG